MDFYYSLCLLYSFFDILWSVDITSFARVLYTRCSHRVVYIMVNVSALATTVIVANARTMI